MEECRTIRGIADLRPGDEIAEAIRDGGGNVLLPAGARLTEASIASLERRGISEVAVRSEDPQAVEALRNALKARLEDLFRRAGDDEPARTLFRAVLAYRTGGQP